ncbi:hypothetical protein BC332_34918 [Capsicum chinense]|nr:hypothetical protein BC332_34918 [Capsicum chinense]
MDALSSKPNHVRSISLPGRSHPTNQRVEEELNKLRSLEVSVAPAAVSNGLIGLEKLYECIDDLLNLPQTLRALSQSLNAKCLDDLLDKSVRLLDVCATMRELVSQCKENQEDQEGRQKISLDPEANGSRDCSAGLARCRSRYSICD